jgi:hypothetical protein
VAMVKCMMADYRVADKDLEIVGTLESVSE